MQMQPGFYPFWFWNGRLEKEEMAHQIELMAQAGFKGFFIHPRQGLEVPYLSESFFDLAQFAMEKAAELGLKACLYDEYPYPSGAAGGKTVMGRPEFQAVCLQTERRGAQAGFNEIALPDGALLALKAYPLDASGLPQWDKPIDLKDCAGPVLTKESLTLAGLTAYNQKRFFVSQPQWRAWFSLPQGQYAVYAVIQRQVTGFKYWNVMPDALNSQAIQLFFAETHGRYAARLQRFLGKNNVAPLLFTDEIEPAWSGLLPEAFERAYGYSLFDEPAALDDPRHPRYIRVQKDLLDLKLKLFIEVYEKRAAAWCHGNGLLYGGEKPSLRLSQMRYMDVPGCDPGHTKAGALPDLMRQKHRGNARAAASAAYFYGKPFALDECFHSLGWSATLQDYKLISELAVLCGISLLVPHAAFYSAHALKKHDAPPSFFFQASFWPFARQLAKRIDALFERFQATHIDPQALILDPNPLVFGTKLHQYERLMNDLTASFYTYMLVDADLLGQIEVSESRARLKETRALALIVPPVDIMEESARQELARLEAAGLLVLRLEDGFSFEAVKQSLRAAGEAALPEAQTDLSCLWSVSRRAVDGSKLVFCVNAKRESGIARWQSALPWHEEAIGSDEPAKLARNGLLYERPIEPYESFLIAEGPAAPEEPCPCVEIHLDWDRLSGSLGGLNNARLNAWRMRVKSAKEAGFSPFYNVSPAPLPNQLAQAQACVQPEFSFSFGQPPQSALPSLSVQYETVFHCAYPGEVWLVCETDSLAGQDIKLSLNGRPLDINSFETADMHMRGSKALKVSPFLQAGANSLAVCMQIDNIDGGLVNPLYLYGQFGVELSPLTITEPALLPGFERYTEGKAPFYHGASFYQAEIDIPPQALAGKAALLHFNFPPGFEEAALIACNGNAARPALWNPRQVKIPVSELKAGRNRLSLTVFNSPARLFEGQWFDSLAHCYKKAGDGP